MLYQLPSGKVLYLSTEEYLGLNDQELHELTHCGYGDEPSFNMYYGSKAEPPKAVINKQKDIDYTPESDEIDSIGPIDISAIPDE